ncbi:MAG: hypothetical protein ABFR97_08575 [Thermodesulfobacteriota bacterium]
MAGRQKKKGVSEGIPLVQYGPGSDGCCRRISSSETETVDVVNGQAWQLIESQAEEARARVLAGQASVIHYYMVINQMDPAMLAGYMGIGRWRVKRHLHPKIFAGLGQGLLSRYANLFQVEAVDLQNRLMLQAVYEEGPGGDED